MNVYFLSSDGDSRIIGQATDWDGIFQEINQFLDDHHFKSYYTRTWEQDNKLFFDVGSWSEFFYIDKGEVNDSV